MAAMSETGAVSDHAAAADMVPSGKPIMSDFKTIYRAVNTLAGVKWF